MNNGILGIGQAIGQGIIIGNTHTIINSRHQQFPTPEEIADSIDNEPTISITPDDDRRCYYSCMMSGQENKCKGSYSTILNGYRNITGEHAIGSSILSGHGYVLHHPNTAVACNLRNFGRREKNIRKISGSDCRLGNDDHIVLIDIYDYCSILLPAGDVNGTEIVIRVMPSKLEDFKVGIRAPPGYHILDREKSDYVQYENVRKYTFILYNDVWILM